MQLILLVPNGSKREDPEMHYLVDGRKTEEKQIEATLGELLEKRVQDAVERAKRGAEFYVDTELPIGFEAVVERKNRKETVKLNGAGKEIRVKRNIGNDNRGLGVSCDPDGTVVPVKTINISFRDHDDPYTDRGIVWVRPGITATMHFTLKGTALTQKGLAGKIVREARRAVESKVLKRFGKSFVGK